jgi:hypothetical protein
MHEARPVIQGERISNILLKIDLRLYPFLSVHSGTKFAANSWIHLYNYEVPNLWGCTGTFDELTED